MGAVGWLLGLLAISSVVRLSGAQSVTLAWNPNSESIVSGYRLHYGHAPRTYTNSVDARLDTSATVTGLVEGATYYFAVTAYTATGVQGPPSSEISYAVPQAPPFIAVVTETESIVMNPKETEPASVSQMQEVFFLEPEPVVESMPILPPGPRLGIELVGGHGTAVKIVFDAPPHQQGELQFTEDFSSWNRLVGFSTGSATESWEYLDLGGAARRFYRVKLN